MSKPDLPPLRLVPLLVVLAAAGPTMLNMPLPAVPGLAAAFSTDVATIQLTITLYLFGMAVSQLVMGPLSDRFGRRPVIFVGLALAVVSSLAAAFADTVGLFLVARLLQSLGASTGIVLGRAIIRDLYERDRAASMIGWVTMAMVVAPMIAPAIGGVLNESIGWRWIFVATALFAAMPLVLTILFLPETRPESEGASAMGVARDAGRLLRNREFLAYTAVAAFYNATFFAFIGGGGHVVVSLMGETSTVYGLWLIVNAFGYMIGNAISGRWSERIGSRRMIVIGAVVGIVATGGQLLIALAGLMTSPAWLFLPQAICAVANGLLLPSALAGAVSVNPRAAGSAAGLSGFLQMALSAAVAQIAGVAVVVWNSPLPMIGLIFASAALACASLRFIRN